VRQELRDALSGLIALTHESLTAAA
jgi:hypothetical protein